MKKKYYILLSLLFIFIFLFFYFFIGIKSDKPGFAFNKQHNAIWISHKWVGENMSELEIEKLVSNFEKYEFDTIFVHSGPLDGMGNVNKDLYPYAKQFITYAKSLNPDIEYQAWLGQIRSKIDLESPSVRENIAKLSKHLVSDIGFDGIHFDIEPVWDEDYAFIKTLEETRKSIPNAKISVALAEFIPKLLISLTKNSKNWKNYNSQVNYTNVSLYADQIVDMVYDTGINSEFWYKLLVREQTIWLSNILEGKELFIAIPSYEDNLRASNPDIENIENGLKGVRDGLNNIRSNVETFSGIAVYSYWETDNAEWNTYINNWVK